jgi:23S rRNA (adenine2503-C2)-methyltransferase
MTVALPPLREIKDEALVAWLSEQGQPAFRAKQIRQWLYEKVVLSATEMTNLPVPLREALARDFAVCSVSLLAEQKDAEGTTKWLLGLADGEVVEAVLIRAPDRLTVCISTQVGCPVRCSFCASGRHGLVRDLTSAEIVDQVVFANHAADRRVDNVVVMGMGEPLLNLEGLMPALDTICSSERGLGIGARHVTVSTSGIVPGIRRLALAGRQWNLALSVHGVTDEGRARLIPPAHRYPLAEILQACREYREATGRMVTLEYALIAGENDSEADREQLAKIARKLRAKVNLIPCNVVGSTHRGSPTERVRSFHEGLLAQGVQATVRRRKGADIQAACGQLRARRQDENQPEMDG